jgi:cell division transport system permease protein
VTDRIAPPASTPYLVAVVACAMAFLAVCALAAGAGAARLAGFWDADLTGTATVRLPADADAEPILAALRGVEGIAEARLLAEDEVAALMLPWLGELPDPLPVRLPRIVDLRLAESPPEAAAVEAALRPVAPAAVYDDHRSWTAPLRRAVSAFRTLVLGAVALTGAALAAMVVVAARASLAGAAATVRTLRLLGARDGFIASSFDRGIGLRALIGAAVGATLAALAIPALPRETLGMSESPGSSDLVWMAVAALPVAAGLLAWVTARAAILVMLRWTP